MNTLQKVIMWVLVVAVVAIGFTMYLGGSSDYGAARAGTGQSFAQPFNALQGFYAGTIGQLQVKNDGSINNNGVTVINSNGIITGVIGGSAQATLKITTSTALLGSWDCQYDTVQQTTSTAAITLTLPPATSTAANCLTQDGSEEVTLINIAAGNAFSMTLATSTGDILAWNATSTAGGALLATSSVGQYYNLTAYRFSPTQVVYTIGNVGAAH